MKNAKCKILKILFLSKHFFRKRNVLCVVYSKLRLIWWNKFFDRAKYAKGEIERWYVKDV